MPQQAAFGKSRYNLGLNEFMAATVILSVGCCCVSLAFVAKRISVMTQD